MSIYIHDLTSQKLDLVCLWYSLLYGCGWFYFSNCSSCVYWL